MGLPPGAIAKHVLVRGLVQGVFFRVSTREYAVDRGVSGWVRNLPDGRVEAHLEGTRLAVDAVIAWMQSGGPPRARVDEVVVRDSVPQREPGFHVR